MWTARVYEVQPISQTPVGTMDEGLEVHNDDHQVLYVAAGFVVVRVVRVVQVVRELPKSGGRWSSFNCAHVVFGLEHQGPSRSIALVVQQERRFRFWFLFALVGMYTFASDGSCPTQFQLIWNQKNVKRHLSRKAVETFTQVSWSFVLQDEHLRISSRPQDPKDLQVSMNPMARCQEQLRFRHLSRWSSTLVTELQNKLTQEDLTLGKIGHVWNRTANIQLFSPEFPFISKYKLCK